MKTALLMLSGLIARDLWCWSIAKVYCWRKRRQTQRQAQIERLQRQREADEKAAAQHDQTLSARAAMKQNQNLSLHFREIVCTLCAEDRRRFCIKDRMGAEN